MANLKQTVKDINKLIGYWTVEEAGGSTIADQDTGSFPFTAFGPLVGQASIVPSNPGGKSAFFDGVDDYMRRDLPAEFRISPIEIMCFFKTTDAWSAGRIWELEPKGAHNDGRGISLTLQANNVLLQKGNGSGFVSLSSGAVISADRTYIVFATVSSSAMKLYVKEVVPNPVDTTVPLTADNSDATAILWSDKVGTFYPDPGQMYIGGRRTDAAVGGPDPLAPDTDFGEFFISDFGIFEDELTSGDRVLIYTTAVETGEAWAHPLDARASFVEPLTVADPIDWVEIGHKE